MRRNPSRKQGRKNARKKSKIYKYVYELESIRKRKKIRHEIKDRVGPLYELKVSAKSHFSFYDAADLDRVEFIKHAIRHDLREYGFKQTSKEIYENKDIVVDLNKLIVSRHGNNIVIHIHEGYLCTKTLRDLLEFDLKSVEQIPDLIRKVRNIGLLPMTVESDPLPQDGKAVSVYYLIGAMEKAMGEEPNELEARTKMLVERHRNFLSLLIKKYPNFKPPTKNTESDMVSIDQFREEHGW